MGHTFLAGVDIGATNLRVAVSNAEGEVEARRAVPFPGGAPEEVLAKVRRTIDDLARGVWVGAEVAAIGVVMPGSVDPARGVVSTPANLPGWGDVPVAAMLSGGRTPVAVENDANAAALGEGWRGAAQGLRDYVFIALGTGIGAGVVADGRLLHGAHFLAGEIAFFAMTREQLRRPGWDDCLESVAGGRALAARAREILGASAGPGDLFDAAESGDGRARAVVQEVQEFLAMAIVQACALLDPEAVVLGGGVATAQGERLLGPVRDLALGCLPAKPRIALSELGEDAQLAGALRLAADMLERGAGRAREPHATA